MTILEPVLTTAEISREKKPATFFENKTVANQGGMIAGNTQKQLKRRRGRK